MPLCFRIICYVMKYRKYFSLPNNIKNDDDDDDIDNDNLFYVWG